jgi:hypothetical protein
MHTVNVPRPDHLKEVPVSEFSNYQVRQETPEEANAFDLCSAGYQAWVEAGMPVSKLKYLNCRFQFPHNPPCKECMKEAAKPKDTGYLDF